MMAVRRAVVVLVAALVVGGCDRGTAAEPGPSTAAPAPGNASPAGSTVPVAAAVTTAAPAPTAPPPTTGVPGLDSDDAFCAAWSRYAGSYQVLAVAAFFLADQPGRAFELEVAAADTVAAAHADLGANWPAELESERGAAWESSYGPFAARAARVGELLAEAGATPAQRRAISAAWLDALARRNPDDPDVPLELDGELAALVAAAATAVAAELPPIPQDPTLVIDTATPLTDAYTASNCPDAGLLAGSDVNG